MNYWLAVGSPENWEIALEQGGIWGLTDRQRYLWERLAENDIVLFYVKRPVGGLIGYGTVQTKFRQTKPLWPQEIAEGTIKWPLCFEFKVEYCLAPDKWNIDRVTSDILKFKAGVGFHQLEPQFATQMLSEFKIAPPPSPEQAEEALSLHDQLKQKLREIGKLQGYVAEPEYSFDIGKLDVVWRKLERSVPTFVFEVHVGGDVYHALAKLKHAFDLWNSHIFIVAPEKERSKVANLLSGTFHEIGNHIKFIKPQKIEELYKLKKACLDLERELGINI